MDAESVYATISDVDKHRTGCVNPAVSQELDLNLTDASTDTFVGQGSTDYSTCKHNPNPGLTAPNNNDVAQESNGRPIEVAVIDVHQSFEGSGDVEKHTGGCLPECEYSVVNHERRCSTCNITRPPRRKDTCGGYDNNIGVKNKKE